MRGAVQTTRGRPAGADTEHPADPRTKVQRVQYIPRILKGNFHIFTNYTNFFNSDSERGSNSRKVYLHATSDAN